jgi:hypothetical protein
MSMLQEYVAASLGVEMGWYTQMSNDLHMYEEHAPAAGTMMLAQDVYSHNIYRTHKIHPTPILQLGERIEDLDSDIDDFFSEFDRCGDVDFIFTSQYHTDFFNFTIAPMLMAWGSRKDKTYSRLYADQIQAQDWCWATREWLGGTK